MTRSILCALLAVISVGAMSVVPVACQSGGIGDPCTPEDEYDTQFPGFKVEQENIESRSFQCATRICLVNHFQGRVSCPLGQSLATITSCNGPDDKSSCAADEECVASQTYAPACAECDGTDDSCAPVGCPDGLTCDKKKQLCVCNGPMQIGKVPFFCDNNTKNGTQTLQSFLCHKKGNCQVAGTDDTTNRANIGKQCCIPGTDTPVGVEVCGQCIAGTHRNAEQAVYCSARCRRQVCTGSTCKAENKIATTGKNSDCGNGTGVCEALPGNKPCSTNADCGDGGTCGTDKKCATLTCFYPDKSTCSSGCGAGTCDNEPGDDSFNYQTCPSGFECSEVRKNVGLGDPNLTGSYCIIKDTGFTQASQCTMVNGNADPNNCAGVGTVNASTDGGT